jgi:hypothetical protein
MCVRELEYSKFIMCCVMSEDDHNRLRNIDAKLYSPLAMKEEDGTVTVIRDAYEQVSDASSLKFE